MGGGGGRARFCARVHNEKNNNVNVILIPSPFRKGEGGMRTTYASKQKQRKMEEHREEERETTCPADTKLRFKIQHLQVVRPEP